MGLRHTLDNRTDLQELSYLHIYWTTNTKYLLKLFLEKLKFVCMNTFIQSSLFIPTFNITTELFIRTNWNGTNLYLRVRWIIVDIQEYCIQYSKKHMLWIFFRSHLREAVLTGFFNFHFSGYFFKKKEALYYNIYPSTQCWISLLQQILFNSKILGKKYCSV